MKVGKDGTRVFIAWALVAAALATGGVRLSPPQGLLAPLSRSQPPKERRLLSLSDIRQVIIAELLPAWQCKEGVANSFGCSNAGVFGGQFVVRFAPKFVPGTQNLKAFAITVTNSKPALNAKVALAYHGSYQIRVSPATPLETLTMKVKMLLGKAGVEGSDTNLMLDMKKHGFRQINTIVNQENVAKLIEEIVDKPTLIRSKTSLFASGVCEGSVDVPCSVIIYPIDITSAGAEVSVGSRQIRSLFPTFNFEENFPVFKNNLIKEFKDCLTKETEAPLLPFPQFQKAIEEQMPAFCNGCQPEKSATPNSDLFGFYDVPFQLTLKQEVSKDGQTIVEDSVLPSRMIGFYFNLRSGKFSMVLFDNPRVTVESVVQLDKKNFGPGFLAEGKDFVELSKADPAEERMEQVMSLESLKTEFEGLKDKCKEGTIVDSPNKKPLFGFRCGGQTVLRVSEVAVEGTLAYRIDFMYLLEAGEGKSTRSSLVLSKVSTFGQFARVKGDIEAYLGKFND